MRGKSLATPYIWSLEILTNFIHFRIVNDQPKTNNGVEGWHRGLQVQLSKAGKLPQKMILKLHDEQMAKQQKMFR